MNIVERRFSTYTTLLEEMLWRVMHALPAEPVGDFSQTVVFVKTRRDARRLVLLLGNQFRTCPHPAFEIVGLNTTESITFRNQNRQRTKVLVLPISAIRLHEPDYSNGICVMAWNVLREDLAQRAVEILANIEGSELHVVLHEECIDSLPQWYLDLRDNVETWLAEQMEECAIDDDPAD